MSNNLVIDQSAFQLPVNIDQSLFDRIVSDFDTAVSNTVSSSLPRISFNRHQFNLTDGGVEQALDSRVLDVFIVAVNKQFHYQFYKNKYSGDPAQDKNNPSMSRYPTEDDPIDYEPTAEWADRSYRHRVVLMIAGDPSHKLYVADLGYNSVKKDNETGGVFQSLKQLMKTFSEFRKQHPNFLPFSIVTQMSFTRESVPVVQFSVYDQRNQNRQIRPIDAESQQAIIDAYNSGEIDNMLKIEYDSRDYQKSEDKQQGQVQSPQFEQRPFQKQPQAQFQQPAQQPQQQFQQPQQQFQQPQQQYQQPAQQPQQQFQQPQAQFQQPVQQQDDGMIEMDSL